MNAVAKEIKTAPAKPTMSSVETLRAHARRKIEEGAVTAGYAANRDQGEGNFDRADRQAAAS